MRVGEAGRAGGSMRQRGRAGNVEEGIVAQWVIVSQIILIVCGAVSAPMAGRVPFGGNRY